MNSKDFRGGCSRSIGFDYITFLSGDFTISQLFPLSVGHQDERLFSQEAFALQAYRDFPLRNIHGTE